ncbi:MAG: cytochrome b N-terminal domain-containing protein [Pseudomonadales bacterium]|nr:cytochrome b N-terminal domain-containing protein [Pseudomonadales bacterium]
MLAALQKFEKLLDRAFPSEWNPMYNLGALSFYLFWICSLTGVYLFVFFETSLDGAWHSVEEITHEQYWIGSIMRSLHRYTSAAMAVTVTLHLLRELTMRRFLRGRWFSWMSGVPLLWLLFASAIGGYWLVWDERAQYIALTTAQLFDALPIVVEPMAFGFLTDATVSDRFFSLLIFLHVGIPLALLLGMFIHIQRIRDSKSNPPKGLAIGTIASLTLLSILNPAMSQAPANLDRSIQTVEIDWFYLNLYPLINEWGPGVVWAILGVVTVGLFIVPLIIRTEKPQIAVVDPEFCNGCGWCYADCPYDAIYMKDHDFRPRNQQAVVISDRCVGCGICAGACPSATPFKNVNEAFSGIDLEEFKMTDVLKEAKERVETKQEEGRILVVGCAHGPSVNQFEDRQVTTETIECIGQMPPSHMDYLVRRKGVDAVLLTGCSCGNCYHRSGIEIQEQRLVREREPHLKFADVREKIEKIWIGHGGEKEIGAKLEEIKSSLTPKSSDGDTEVDYDQAS